jgi:hypothetical protein
MDGIDGVGGRLREIADRIAEIREHVTTPPNPFNESPSAQQGAEAGSSASADAGSSVARGGAEFDALLQEATALSNASLTASSLLNPTGETNGAVETRTAATHSISEERLALLRRLLEITAPTSTSESGSAASTEQR